MADHFISRDDAERDLLTAAAFLAENIRSADGHAEAMKTIVPIYLAEGNVDLAAELANQVTEPFSRDRLLIQVAEKCAAIDDDEYASQLADAIEDEGMRGQAFERVALVKVEKGEIEKAEDHASRMTHPDRVLAAIAVRQLIAGEAVADETLGRINYPTAEVGALLLAAGAFVEKGDHARAAVMATRAVEAAREIEHDEEKLRALCDAGNAFVEAKRSDLAVETFDEARSAAEVLDNIHRESFLMNCALGFKVAGSDDLAEGTLDLITDKTEMASALLAFAREDWRADRKEDAVEGLEEAVEILRSQREREVRDSRSRNAIMTNVAVQLAAFGKAEAAIEIADQHTNPDERMSGLTQIAQLQVIAGDAEKARETLELITDDSQRLFALISVSDAHERAGNHEKAVEFLDEATAFVSEVPQLASRSNALNELISRYASYGKTERARDIALENLDVITDIKDESSQAAALAGLAEAYKDAELDAADAELAKVRVMLNRIP